MIVADSRKVTRSPFATLFKHVVVKALTGLRSVRLTVEFPDGSTRVFGPPFAERAAARLDVRVEEMYAEPGRFVMTGQFFGAPEDGGRDRAGLFSLAAPIPEGGGAAAIDANSQHLRDLPVLVAKDLTFLLRVERVLRMWAPSGNAGREETPPSPFRNEILVRLAREARGYLDNCEETEVYQRDVLVPVLRCLAKAAKIDVPSEVAALLDIITSGTSAPRGL